MEYKITVHPQVTTAALFCSLFLIVIVHSVCSESKITIRTPVPLIKGCTVRPTVEGGQEKAVNLAVQYNGVMIYPCRRVQHNQSRDSSTVWSKRKDSRKV